MAISIVMPALEMAQDSGKLLSWSKREGEQVAKGDIIAEVETDKAVVELESPADGFLAGIAHEEGAIVPVGQTIAWIVAAGEKPPAVEAASPVALAPTQTEETKSKPPAAPASRDAGEANPGRISPKARRMAKEMGVDLSDIQGTGPDGMITGDDVEAAAKKGKESPADSSAETSSDSLSTIAKLMAERTTAAWTSVPHFFVRRKLNARNLLLEKEQLGKSPEASQGLRFTLTDILVAVIARVLKKHPQMNASWTGSAIHTNSEINIGLAVAMKDGVVTAVIPGADALALPAIAKLRSELAERAKNGRLKPADMAGGTFTISNLGMFGIDSFEAIIIQPQAAILAIGRVADSVQPVNGQPSVEPMMELSLSSDHRVVDGARAAAFMSDLADALENPKSLLS
jgi:pyruvate dehydrogenase E2 component (dihydrolipoamide acetyltransferase)